MGQTEAYYSFLSDLSVAVEAPAPARHRNPEQLLYRCSPRIVQSSHSLLEPSCVPRVCKAELLEIEMVADFVTQCAQERSEGSDFFAYRRPYPDPDQHGFGTIVSEEFRAPTFSDSQWSGRKDMDRTIRHFVEPLMRLSEIVRQHGEDPQFECLSSLPR
jgi:hypothetical protein